MRGGRPAKACREFQGNGIRCTVCQGTTLAHEARRKRAIQQQRAERNPGDPYAPRKLDPAKVYRRPPPPAPPPPSKFVPVPPPQRRPERKRRERAPRFVEVDATQVEPRALSDGYGGWG